MVSKAVVLAPGDSPAPSNANGRRTSHWELASVALLPIANRPMLLHALDALEGAGISEVAVIADSGVAEEFSPLLAVEERFPFELYWVKRAPGSSLASALDLVDGHVTDEPFVLHLGDSLSKGALALALDGDCPGPCDAVVLVERDAHATTHLLDISASWRPGTQLRGCKQAGAYVLGAGILDALRAAGNCGSTELEVTAALERADELGGTIELRPVNEWWRYRGRRESLLDANRFMLEGLRARGEVLHHVNTRLEGNVVVHPSARLESTIVRGPAIIGPGVCLINAYIGPYSAISADVHIEGAEVENSIVLRGSSISHLGGRLEASIIGPDARVYRDFQLPTALRLDIGAGAKISLA